jgi:hypothetical protein
VNGLALNAVFLPRDPQNVNVNVNAVLLNAVHPFPEPFSPASNVLNGQNV